MTDAKIPTSHSTVEFRGNMKYVCSDGQGKRELGMGGDDEDRFMAICEEIGDYMLSAMEEYEANSASLPRDFALDGNVELESFSHIFADYYGVPVFVSFFALGLYIYHNEDDFRWFALNFKRGRH